MQDGSVDTNVDIDERSLQLCCRHWEYDLHKLDILSVDVAEGGHSAVILAALQVCAERMIRCV